MNILKMNYLRNAMLCLATLVLFASCASKPKIHSVHESGVDFDSYETYAFLDSLTPEGQEYQSLVGKYLKESISTELKAVGMTEASSADAADVLIGFNISTKEKIQSTSSPSMYYGYRGGYGYTWGAGYGTETRISQYTEGTLNIDVVDAAQKQLVWEGVAVGRLKESEIKDLRTDVSTVVNMIFAEYPLNKAEKK